jgi:3-oxoacyl-[acyl-carrier protein] reductase
MFSLAGKVALVTGASRGIGRAVAIALATQGADVAICARTEAALTDVAGEIEALGRRAFVAVADLTDRSSADRVVAGTVEALGRLDILVNNAGVTRDGLVMRMKDEDFDTVVQTNLGGTFAFSRAATRIMIKQRSGRLIHISSVVGVKGNAGQANYAASKAGIVGLSLSLAKELAGRGITSNAIAPGFISTEMTASLSAEYRDKLLEMIPLGCFGTPDDVAAVVCFLAADESRYVNGEVIQVDGGMRL